MPDDYGSMLLRLRQVPLAGAALLLVASPVLVSALAGEDAGSAASAGCQTAENTWLAQTQFGASRVVPDDLGKTLQQLAEQDPDVCEARDTSPSGGAQYAQVDYKVRAQSRADAERIAQRVTDAVREAALDDLPGGYSWNASSSVIGQIASGKADDASSGS